MSEILENLAYLGPAFIMYCIGHLLNEVSIYFDAPGKSEILSKASAFTSFIFMFFGFPVWAILYFVQRSSKRRICDFARREEREEMKQYCETEVRIAVQEEHDRLVEYYRDLLDRERHNSLIHMRDKCSTCPYKYPTVNDDPQSIAEP